MKKILVVLLAVAIALVGFGGGAEAATYHMNADASEDCQNLVECFTLLSEGDTLIIRDGVYTGYDNAMMHSPSSHIPPSGLGGDYITIKAENEGRVIFDGENERSMVYFNTGDPTFSYVIFEGIIWAHNRSDRSHTWAGLDHVKILRCGFLRTEGDGGASNFRLVDSSYVLVEECYSWGDGRYAFMTQTSDYIIFRRRTHEN